MATNTISDHRIATSNHSALTLTNIAKAILMPIASLKLTVALLIIAVFVTWAITLEQATTDIWALKNKHFNNLWVFIPIKTFFPPNWFPEFPDVSMGLILPSGLTIICGLLANLIAAHLIRFKIQASGSRLYIGIAVLIASAWLTYAVIFNYQDSDGFGGTPPVSWERMWVYLQIAVFGIGVAAMYGALSIGQGRRTEQVMYGLIAAALFILVGLSQWYGEDAFIGDSAMRVMWQLTQSTVAAVAVLIGCILLFKRKAGIVLVHLGIAGLLVNELFVTITNEEHRISFAEGQTVHHAIDLRETEFVTIDRSDDEFDSMTVLPESILKSATDPIDDERMPFKIRCVDFFANSDVVRVGPMAENKATAGFGKSFIAVERAPTAGADADGAVNRASAYVELIDRSSNQPMGTYLVSQAAYEQGIVDTVTFQDKDYQIGLRFKTVYPPYSVTLKDTRAEYYVGTEIPSWFSSDFVIDDPQHNIKSDQKISMNNPLRYRDQTFYQTSYSKDGNTEYSGIQVVRNRGWMIPYVCCMFAVVGLVAQFQQSLSSHLAKGTKPKRDSRDKDANAAEPTTTPSFFGRWGPTLVLGGLFGLYMASSYVRSVDPVVTKSKSSELRLDLLGQIPVTFGGRVQPLDSYARNLARQLGNREYVVDEFGNKQPAIRWLADTMFGAPAADKYQILRVEDMNVQNALGLPRRKGLKYSFAEIRGANDKLNELLDEFRNLPPKQWSVFQKRIYEVYSKSRMIMGAQLAMTGTADRYDAGDDLGRLELAGSLAVSKSNLPLMIPTEDPATPWLALPLVAESDFIRSLEKKFAASNPEVLAEKLLAIDMRQSEEELIKRTIISELLRYEEIVEGLTAKFELDNSEELASILYRNWHQIPPHLYQDEYETAEKFVEFQLTRFKEKRAPELASLISEINQSAPDVPFDPAIPTQLSELKELYLDDDAEGFNSNLEEHFSNVVALSPKDFQPSDHFKEITYNYFSPFYMATVLYVAAFVVTIFSWLGMLRPLNRAAFCLICLGLAIQIFGIVDRVMISNRPPITNLYSSWVVVSAGSIFLLLGIEYFTRISIGNLLAAITGFASLLYAFSLSISQGDTFTVLRAVLDTQFWLTTHVIIINLGYSATLVAGALGVVFLLISMFGRIDKNTSRNLSNIIYGCVCFALLFSFFGTVLGGLWADDSWGRFWGWDPKENGALMIVLWNAVILHARWGGMAKEKGIAALAAIGNSVVIWSWEGVNQLGVGLHAYGGVDNGASVGSFLTEPMFYMQAFVVFSFLVAGLGTMLPSGLFRSSTTENQPQPG